MSSCNLIFWKGSTTKTQSVRSLGVNAALGPIYTKRQRQRCNDACDPALIDHMLQNGLQPHSEGTPLWSTRDVSQASSQR